MGTGITGLRVHPDPRPKLLSLYQETLQKVQTKLPKHAVYGQAVQRLTQQRQKIVEENQDAREIEKLLGVQRIELLIEEAEAELKLMEDMAEWKSWETLEEAAPEGQWK